MCAQQSEFDFTFSNSVFQNYTMKNGLTSNYCYEVLQDHKGYIWVATLNGLSRFNGNTWLNFQQQSKQTKYKLPANWVVDIDEDKLGNVWINTDIGIAMYHQKKDSIISFPKPIKGWGKISCTNTNQLLVSSWTGIIQLQQKNRQLSSTGNFSNLTTYGNDIVNNTTYGLLSNSAAKSSYLINNGICVTATGIKTTQQNFSISLFPNPSNGLFSIQTTNTVKSIKIYDIIGHEVNYLAVNETTFKINQNSGVYFVTIVDTNNHSKTIKLILN
jgi:ligand-binding sensor domain-containing protein